MKINLLYFEGCPSWKKGLANLQSALEVEGLKAEICLIRISNDEDAKRLKFLGSPSFQVNGIDLWFEKRNRYNLSCRVYPTSEGMKGMPTVEMLREKLNPFNLMEDEV